MTAVLESGLDSTPCIPSKVIQGFGRAKYKKMERHKQIPTVLGEESGRS